MKTSPNRRDTIRPIKRSRKLSLEPEQLRLNRRDPFPKFNLKYRTIPAKSCRPLVLFTVPSPNVSETVFNRKRNVGAAPFGYFQFSAGENRKTDPLSAVLKWTPRSSYLIVPMKIAFPHWPRRRSQSFYESASGFHSSLFNKSLILLHTMDFTATFSQRLRYGSPRAAGDISRILDDQPGKKRLRRSTPRDSLRRERSPSWADRLEPRTEPVETDFGALSRNRNVKPRRGPWSARKTCEMPRKLPVKANPTEKEPEW